MHSSALPTKKLAEKQLQAQPLNLETINNVCNYTIGSINSDKKRRLGWHSVGDAPLPHISAEDRDAFIEDKVLAVIFHPEYISPNVIRCDIQWDSDGELIKQSNSSSFYTQPDHEDENNYTRDTYLALRRKIVIKYIARNRRRDNDLVQHILIYRRSVNARNSEVVPEVLVVLVPQVGSLQNIPFYFPAVQSLRFRVAEKRLFIEHLLDSKEQVDTDQQILSNRRSRMTEHLLFIALKRLADPNYVKKFNHDVIVPRERYQTKYQDVKERHGRRICRIFGSEKNRETEKVFEELAIAAWLICVWEDVYEKPVQRDDVSKRSFTVKRKEWPGFVDIGCGNGVLVDVLVGEGWTGWGFDARARKSWRNFSKETQACLKEMILVPYLLLRRPIYQTQLEEAHVKLYIPGDVKNTDLLDELSRYSLPNLGFSEISGPIALGNQDDAVVHPGIFPENTFLISNHGDEMTPWTPLLASLSRCPFFVLPCCSHDLSGKRFRAKPALTLTDRKNKKESTYQSLVGYVNRICEKLDICVEKDILRIPSTRNIALLGRQAKEAENGTDTANITYRRSEDRVVSVIEEYGGADGWIDRALLVKTNQLGIVQT